MELSILSPPERAGEDQKCSPHLVFAVKPGSGRQSMTLQTQVGPPEHTNPQIGRQSTHL